MAFRNQKPPKGYIPGLGRGASGFATQGDIGPAAPAGAKNVETFGSRAAAAHRAARVAQSARESGDLRDQDESKQDYTAEDQEADDIYAAISERMAPRKRSRLADQGTVRQRIGAQFRDLKTELASVSEEQWAAIPDVGDKSLKFKQKRKVDTFTPLSDSLIETRTIANKDATAGAKIAGTTVADSGYQTVVSNMSGLAEARGTVLTLSLDKVSGSASARPALDSEGYLTSLAPTASTINSADIADVSKARLLLKSVRDTNPHHGPAWIASARVEEAAGKLQEARKVIQQGCEACSTSEDVWLEAARLHQKHGMAKSILASAIQRIPSSIKLFLKAAELEDQAEAKKRVFRKALETNPSSVLLWKAAIGLEDADHAKVMLGVAVEKVPHAVELWLALARLETYENAKKVLNKARKVLPAERSIWLSAAKLEESQNHDQNVDNVVAKAVKSLHKNGALVTREQWLTEAEKAETAGAPLTCAAIVRHTIGLGIEMEDRQRTWAEDALGTLARRNVCTARAILATALAAFPKKASLWKQAVKLEQEHGTPTALDEVLAAACQRLPQNILFWLHRAKERWLKGDVDGAREILADAFAANPNSQQVWLAAAKLEWESGEIERARLLLHRARERAPSGLVYMKSALLEREQHEAEEALQLIEEGIRKFPSFPKFYMMGGQIWSEDLGKTKLHLEKARRMYERGIQNCQSSETIWILASRLEEQAHSFEGGGSKSAGLTKSRSLLELARQQIPQCPDLWLEATRLERRSRNINLAETLMARALQECAKSGILLAESIRTAPKVKQKSRAADAIKQAPEDANVVLAVAELFALQRKDAKARKYFDRALHLNSDLGDCWARYYAFELAVGTKEQQERVKKRCMLADPKHGEQWTAVSKDIKNRWKSTDQILEIVSSNF